LSPRKDRAHAEAKAGLRIKKEYQMHKHLVLLIALAASLIAPGLVEAGGTHGQSLSAVTGQGAGMVNLTAIPGEAGLTVEVTVNVHQTTPNATFYIQRAPEIGRPLGNDGICQRANALWPWEQPNSDGFPPAPAFVSVPRPLAGDLKTLTTDADGSGSTHFALNFPAIPDGTVFDVQFRLIDSLTAPTTNLQTGCFAVTAK
jgi:hypothetical protein